MSRFLLAVKFKDKLGRDLSKTVGLWPVDHYDLAVVGVMDLVDARRIKLQPREARRLPFLRS